MTPIGPQQHPHKGRYAGKKTAAVLVVALLLTTALRGQDIHFSQLDVNPLLFNPAYAGFFDAMGRFGVAYRNQWASVSTPFQTITLTGEWNVFRSRKNYNSISVGGWISTDRAGTLGYGSTTASAIGSFFFSPTRDNDNFVSVAIEAGVGQSGFSTQNIELSESSESFSRTQAIYPLLGVGAAWFRQMSDVFYTKLGLSVRNINQPDISYSGFYDSRLARKYNIYARAEWRATSQFGILPVVGWQRQSQFSELLYGCDVRWYVRESSRDYLAFDAGVIGRHADAAAINLAVEWLSWIFAFSYDINISTLASASHTIGAFEIGVVYKVIKQDPRKRALPCPII